MARAVETTNAASFAKFANLGDRLIGAFGGGKVRQQRNFDTKAPLFKADGSTPAKEEVMYFVVMPGTTAVTGDLQGGNPTPLTEGTEARFAVSGFKWGQVIDGRKQLPARSGFKQGQACSGDVYEIILSGWSAETKNAQAAQAAGFTVVDGRIVLRSQEDKDKYVLAQSRNGGNTNPGKDFTITVRRPLDTEKAWEQAADELFDSKPWEHTGDDSPAATGGAQAYDPQTDEPF